MAFTFYCIRDSFTSLIFIYNSYSQFMVDIIIMVTHDNEELIIGL